MAKASMSFSQWVESNRLVFGILLNGRTGENRASECIEITQRNLLLHNDAGRTNYMEGSTIDSMLWSAWLWRYKYLWIQAPGHYILDKPGVQIALDQEFEQGFFVLGHILDLGEKYYSIHHQSIIVNLEVWEDIGKPPFGLPGVETRSLHIPLRSEENFHDTHTPKWIKRSGAAKLFKEQADGWQFLSHGLDHDVRVAPFSSAIRARKGYLYPEDCTFPENP